MISDLMKQVQVRKTLNKYALNSNSSQNFLSSFQSSMINSALGEQA